MVQVRIDELTESPWDTTGVADTEVVVMVTHGDNTFTLGRKDLADAAKEEPAWSYSSRRVWVYSLGCTLAALASKRSPR